MPAKNQVVVYAPRSALKKQKRRRPRKARKLQLVVRQRSRRIVSPNMPMKTADSAARQFQLALRDPFAPEALGVRAIDSVCYPTTVSHLRFKMACTTTASGTFSATILPFLHANMLLNAGVTAGAPGYWANNTSVSYVTGQTALKNFYSSFRVVAWGARVILTDANQTAKGVYTVCPVLLGGNVPGEATLSVAATDIAAIRAAFGTPEPTEAIASMPGAVAINAQDLMQKGELTMRGLAYSSAAYTMRKLINTSSWNATSGFYVQGGLWAAGTATVPAVELSNAYNGDGQIGYLLSVSGAPASTAEFSIEYIYHLEGVPQPSTGVVMTSTPSPAGSTTAIERILAAMHTAGEYFTLGTAVAERLGNLGTQMYRFRNRTRALLT